MNTWFIADTHFGHKNIINYCDRPFENIEQMDNAMVERWNGTVGSRDKVYMLGDFSFYNKDKTRETLAKLTGEKYLIMGNHDNRMHFDSSFDWHYVYDKPIIIEDGIILSHEPLFVNKHMPYINIYGHVHQNGCHGLNKFCASVELIDYSPVSLDKVQSVIEQYRKEEL